MENISISLFNVIESSIPAILANIISAFIVVLISYCYVTTPKVKISAKITKGITKSDGESKIAYKFKIINTSRLFIARDFSVKLFAVKKILQEREGVYTPHHSPPIEVRYGGLQELSPFLSKKKFYRIMSSNNIDPDANYSFVYRIITLINVEEKYKDYDGFKLYITYKDTLGHVFLISKYIKKDIIVGDFTCDGDLDKINEMSEEDNAELERLSRATHN